MPAHPTDRMGVNISGGLPAIGGITPSRAELPVSAFAKLDAQRRGYLTRQDVASLDGFDGAFHAADRDGDGRLDAAEFERAWAIYAARTN